MDNAQGSVSPNNASIYWVICERPLRQPFHLGLFYSAMRGSLERKPDQETIRDDEGFCQFVYVPHNSTERQKFSVCANCLTKMLDTFEIQFSGSRCEYGSRNDPSCGEEPVLHIVDGLFH